MAHLTDDQILDRIAGLAVSPEPDEHLGACPECRARYQRLSTISNQLDQLKNSPLATAPCGPCRPIAVWWRVAAGKSKEPELSEALAHAAECAECSETLKNAIADLNQDDAEEAEGRNRNAIDGDVLAAQLRAGAHPPIPFWRKPVLRYGASAIAAALVLAAAYSLLKGPSPAQTDRLLAQAFTERRTIPMRFPGANDSPLRQERSSKPADTPVALMEAELQIAKASGESDPQWLDLKARAALLHWDYEAAIDSIERAQTLAKKNSTLAPALLGDLAMAFFERGEAENRAADYASAVENFSKAIAISPSNALLRFNRAATYERLFLYTQAADDWKEAVRLEPSGAWADEARSHLKALEEKKRSEVGTLTPRAYLDRRGEGLDPEFALRPATESWLQLIADDNAEATEAFEAMASDLERVHGDPWMKDLSAALKHPLGRQSYGALARAIHANAAGQAQSAEQLAREAGSIFQTLGNRAGLLYAKFEAAYAQQRALRRDDCAEATQDLTRSIPENYRWLLAQSWTERGVCRYHTGDLGGSWNDLETAARYARQGKYREPAFRALSFQNDYRAELGDSLGAWEGNLAGLSDVWSGPHEAISPFHFYSGMTTLATLAGNWNMALAAKREAMNAIAALNNPSLDAVNHYRVASLALSASQDRTAEEEFEVARRLFQSLPADNQTKAYQFAAELGRAQAESDAKNFRDSKDRLTKMSGELESFKDSAMRLRYHDLLGRLDLAEGDRTAADRELAIAHDLAVKSRESLKDARQQSVWMNDQRRLYHTLLDVSATPAGAWTTWREFHGSTSPPSSANAISFAVLPDRIMAWATLGGRWIPAVQPIASADLQALTGEFRRACEDPNIPLDRIRGMGRRLYDLLLGPFGTEITGRIEIEPDGSLAGIPWEALVAKDGRWAGERASFVIALEGLSGADELRVDKHSHALIVAATGSGRDGRRVMQPLPGADREAKSIAAMFDDAKVLAGAGASFDEVQKNIPSAEIFHFAGHHGGSGLLLSDPGSGGPGALNVAAFASQPQSCKLAVLSACRTAATPAGDEWDPDTLIGTLHRMGVHDVVASRWAVDSERTADLMEQFYRRLLGGSTADAALAQAASTIREANPHPYYWAAFADFVQ